VALAVFFRSFVAPAPTLVGLADFLAAAYRLSCPCRIFSSVSALMALRFGEAFFAGAGVIAFATLPSFGLGSVAASSARAC
jgi:hypothetical protein